jgi:LysR family cys regulon transcriptional activator
MYDFIELFAPHLSSQVVQAAERAQSHEELAALFSHVQLPVY